MIRRTLGAFVLSTILFAQSYPFPGPANLAPHRAGSYVFLTWINISESNTNNVYRGSVHGGPYTLIWQSVRLVNHYTDPGCSGTCFYVVTAVNTSGESSYSNEVSAFVP